MPKKRQALLAAVTGLLVLAFLECAADLAAFASPRVAALLAPPWEAAGSEGIPDPRLGVRPNPNFADHDRNGFRNPGVPAQADVVVFGDSQTYGTGVPAEAAWPAQLHELSGRTVYSIAFGGFGPVHSVLLWDQAVQLRPKVIIEALYAGNDLYDTFNIVYNRSQLTELKSVSPDRRRRVEAAEKDEPLAAYVDRMFRLGRSESPSITDSVEAHSGFSPRQIIADHSGLFGMVRRAKFVVLERLARARRDTDQEWQEELAFVRAHPAYCQVYDDGKVKTVFTSEYRLAALDLDDPRLAEGAHLAFGALDELHRRAGAAGVRFIVMMIPTKEFVFRERTHAATASYLRLMEQEDRFRQMTEAHVRENNIEYIDALPALRNVLESGGNPYRVTHDGHPNARGYQAIAELMAASLARN